MWTTYVCMVQYSSIKRDIIYGRSHNGQITQNSPGGGTIDAQRVNTRTVIYLVAVPTNLAHLMCQAEPNPNPNPNPMIITVGRSPTFVSWLKVGGRGRPV